MFRNSVIDPDYCQKHHNCHYIEDDPMCPMHSSFEHRECHINYHHGAKIKWINCLNRKDAQREMFSSPRFSMMLRLPLLNSVLNFTSDGFYCNKDTIIQWNKGSLNKLFYGTIQSCDFGRRGTTMAGRYLYRLLENDLSFKGRNVVENYDQLFW